MEAGLPMAGAYPIEPLKAVWKQGKELWWGRLVNRWGPRGRVSTRGARSSLGEAWSHLKSPEVAGASGHTWRSCEGGH